MPAAWSAESPRTGAESTGAYDAFDLLSCSWLFGSQSRRRKKHLRESQTKGKLVIAYFVSKSGPGVVWAPFLLSLDQSLEVLTPQNIQKKKRKKKKKKKKRERRRKKTHFLDFFLVVRGSVPAACGGDGAPLNIPEHVTESSR